MCERGECPCHTLTSEAAPNSPSSEDLFTSVLLTCKEQWQSSNLPGSRVWGYSHRHSNHHWNWESNNLPGPPNSNTKSRPRTAPIFSHFGGRGNICGFSCRGFFQQNIKNLQFSSSTSGIAWALSRENHEKRPKGTREKAKARRW